MLLKLVPYKNRDDKRLYQRTWRAARRAAFFKGKVCANCGSLKDLELDHLDPSKKADHKIWSWSKERRDAELAKCQALCEECHKQKTIQYDMPRTDHGRGQMYQHYKCRCDACRAWKRASYKTSVQASSVPCQ